ncbi:homeobox-leucine zipper protein GLABRA 2 [Senna tora]|uniref:Homeobox-leucine zipper protein GLABRA 2 n=1 Tax=Senna tora TaxID=362788 RepID=A0A834T2T8_9FABA|nr:homeobox-leucine zipper protein GLABRA 2 [Senna tora]
MELDVEISSENSGGLAGRSSRSDDGFDGEGEPDGDGDGDGDKKKKKKRKKLQRHTAEQIREMEAVFKESPHPDEKQRQQLSQQLGLAPTQVKFWFQNRRTQIKAIQERHENSLLKSEMDKLREENKAMRETVTKASCLNCACTAIPSSSSQHQLLLENAKLKAEIEKLGAELGKKTTWSLLSLSPSSSSSPTTTSTCYRGKNIIIEEKDQDDENDNNNNNKKNRKFWDFEKNEMNWGGVDDEEERKRIMEMVKEAMEELRKMATTNEPLWVPSASESGRHLLNYDEYVKHFSSSSSLENNDINININVSDIEASRETGVVSLDLPRLLQIFMDVNEWREMFGCLISKAATIDVICSGEGANKDGAVQLVIWVEHLEWEKRRRVDTMYRSMVHSGLPFGAKHWLATLQLQCERLVFFMATNIPIKDSTGVGTVAGRKSILKLGERMTQSFCQAIGGSSLHSWRKLRSDENGENIRISSRNNLNDPGHPLGLILCAVCCVWLPVSPNLLFHFLRDQARRTEWDMTSAGGSVQSIANLAKGKDRGNAVTILAVKSQDKKSIKWILQDSCTNAYESMVVYAPVDITPMQSVITGCDSSNLPILPSGFSILPDGIRPSVITSKHQENTNGGGGRGGSLLAMAFQLLASTSPTAKLTRESVESVNTLISCTLRNIRTSLQCEDC